MCIFVCVCVCVHPPACSDIWLYLHELEGGLKVLHGVHLDAEELDAHDEADGALGHVRALLLLPQLLQLGYELLPHRRESDGERRRVERAGRGRERKRDER